MSDLVRVATVRLPYEAQLIKDYLEAEGIPCLVQGATAVSTVGPINELNISWGNPVGGIEIQVRAEDEAAARASLQALEDSNNSSPES